MIEVTKIIREENEAQGQRRFIFHLKAPRTFGLTDNKLILGYPVEFENLNNLGEAVLFSLLPIAFSEASDIALPNELAIEKETLERVNRIYELWNKWFLCNRKIKIGTEFRSIPNNSNTQRYNAQLFSGGIDSLATFQRQHDKVAFLVFYHGADIKLSNFERFREVKENTQQNPKPSQIKDVIDFFEDSLLINVIESFEHRLKRTKDRVRICLCDHAIRASWLKERIPLYGNNVNVDLAGHIIESIIGNYLSTVEGLGISFLPSNQNAGEVDLIMGIGDIHIPIEIKYQNNPCLSSKVL